MTRNKPKVCTCARLPFPEWQQCRAERDDLPAFLKRDSSPAIVEQQERVAAVRAALAVMLHHE